MFGKIRCYVSGNILHHTIWCQQVEQIEIIGSYAVKRKAMDIILFMKYSLSFYLCLMTNACHAMHNCTSFIMKVFVGL